MTHYERVKSAYWRWKGPPLTDLFELVAEEMAAAVGDAVRDAESEADALRSENLQLRRQLADAEARHASVVQPPTMDGPVPTTTGTYR